MKTNFDIKNMLKKYKSLFFLILATIILCYSSLHYFILNEQKTFQASGPIGDAFAGLTTPIIGLITVVLVYMTYKSQKEELEKTRELVNKQTQFMKEQTENSKLDQKINSVENLIKEFYFFIEDLEWNGRKGIRAIREYDITRTDVTTGLLDELNGVLLRFEILIKEVSAIPIEKNVKADYLNRIYTLYYSKILWNTKQNIFDKQKDHIMGKNDDAQLIIPKYVIISLKTLDYMRAVGLAKESKYKKENIADFEKFLSDYKISRD